MDCCEEAPRLKKQGMVYSVRGSGWVTVPEQRINEIVELRKEFHEQELKRARIVARYRKVA